ncbi:hypothetical protein [Streptomyces mirabilis]|uniref:hypothetical protein n=1 Tax=Streptomyces mirabilis TaxID=68239 RepID=UPI0036E7BE45
MPSIKTTSLPRLAIFFRAGSSREAFAASWPMISSRQRRTVVAEMLLPSGRTVVGVLHAGPACHIGQARVVPKHREDDQRHLPGRQRSPA